MTQQTLSGSFTAVGASALMYVRPNESLDFAVSGTFVATMLLQSTQNGGQVWDTERTITAPSSGRIEKSPGRQYRIICRDYTSGTVVWSISQVNDVISESRDASGAATRTTEEGVDSRARFSNNVLLANLISVDVTLTAALLDSAGKISVIPAGAGLNATDQYKIRDITLVGAGTNFDAAGDRDLSLTDGTTVWTTVANADLESVPAASLRWGNAKVPMLTGTSDTASVAGAQIYFAYSGGTTDHGGVGSVKANVLLEKAA